MSSVVSHGAPATGAEPGMRDYFFERVRPIVEQALRDGNHDDWPLVTLNLDLKSEEPEHLAAIWQLLAEYNQPLILSPEMDHGFAQLADERVRAHPVRYYVFLPLARLADMWLRPRTEMLNLQLDWWNWENVPQESAASLEIGRAHV